MVPVWVMWMTLMHGDVKVFKAGDLVYSKIKQQQGIIVSGPGQGSYVCSFPNGKRYYQEWNDLEKMEQMKEEQGIKHDQEKVRLDLIPAECIMALGQVLTHGAKKYGDNNWKNGLKLTRIAGALLRHWFQSCLGEKNDKESGLPHTWHVLCNAMFIVWMEKNKPDMDDR